MTRAALVPGGSLQQARNRMLAAGMWLPRLLSDGTSGTTSDRPDITVTSGGTTHTVGAWAQVVASLSEDVGFVRAVPVTPVSNSAGDSSALLNIGTGAAGSETTIIDSIGFGFTGATSLNSHPGWLFPVFIPRGTRVAIQSQGATLSLGTNWRFEFFAPVEGVKPSTKILAIGATLAASRGVVLTAPGGANTEAAWTQLVASTSEPYSALGVSIQGGSDTTQSAAKQLVDIGVGAAGSEAAIISNIVVEMLSTESMYNKGSLVHPVSIPRGSRIAARYQTSATGGSLDVILHPIRAAA